MSSALKADREFDPCWPWHRVYSESRIATHYSGVSLLHHAAGLHWEVDEHRDLVIIIIVFVSAAPGSQSERCRRASVLSIVLP